jgi:hypothetical protein
MRLSVFGNHERQGNCHHCGWHQPLRKVTGHEAAVVRHNSATGPRTGLRWLCEECIADLTSAGQGERVLVRVSPFPQASETSTRHRSVA